MSGLTMRRKAAMEAQGNTDAIDGTSTQYSNGGPAMYLTAEVTPQRMHELSTWYRVTVRDTSGRLFGQVDFVRHGFHADTVEALAVRAMWGLPVEPVTGLWPHEGRWLMMCKTNNKENEKL